VPQILINREPLRHIGFDVELLGDCDVIVNELCHRLGDTWKYLCTTAEPAVEMDREVSTEAIPASQPTLGKLGEAERICSDGHDSLLGLQSEPDDTNVSDNHVNMVHESVQPNECDHRRNTCDSAGSTELGHRRRQDSSGSTERHLHRFDSGRDGGQAHHRMRRNSIGAIVHDGTHEHHRARLNSIGAIVHDGRLNQSSVTTHNNGALVSSAENTVDTVTERNKVLESIQRHDQDANREASSQPINWASLLTGNQFCR